MTYHARADAHQLPFEIQPLTEGFGVEILGVALGDRTPPEVMAAVRDVLLVESLVLLRDQHWSADEQVAVASRFGSPPVEQEHVWAPNVDPDVEPGKETHWGSYRGHLPLLNRGDLLYFVNGPGLCEKDVDTYTLWDEEEAHDKGLGASCWHTGDTEKYDTELVSLLYAELAAKAGGDTMWCDMAGAYEALDPATRDRIDDLRVVHYFVSPQPSEPISQPLVKRHPVTGRNHCYLNFATMERIEGFSQRESFDLLHSLFRHHCQDRFVYRHAWKDRDVVLWNNNPTMHKRTSLVSGVRRIMRRTQARMPELQSQRPCERSRNHVKPDGENWHPYPFNQAPASSL